MTVIISSGPEWPSPAQFEAVVSHGGPVAVYGNGVLTLPGSSVAEGKLLRCLPTSGTRMHERDDVCVVEVAANSFEEGRYARRGLDSSVDVSSDGERIQYVGKERCRTEGLGAVVHYSENMCHRDEGPAAYTVDGLHAAWYADDRDITDAWRRIGDGVYSPYSKQSMESIYSETERYYSKEFLEEQLYAAALHYRSDKSNDFAAAILQDGMHFYANCYKEKYGGEIVEEMVEANGPFNYLRETVSPRAAFLYREHEDLFAGPGVWDSERRWNLQKGSRWVGDDYLVEIGVDDTSGSPDLHVATHGHEVSLTPDMVRVCKYEGIPLDSLRGVYMQREQVIVSNKMTGEQHYLDYECTQEWRFGRDRELHRLGKPARLACLAIDREREVVDWELAYFYHDKEYTDGVDHIRMHAESPEEAGLRLEHDIGMALCSLLHPDAPREDRQVAKSYLRLHPHRLETALQALEGLDEGDRDQVLCGLME